MARLPYLKQDDLHDEDKHLLDRDINLLKVLAHSPGGLNAFNQLTQYISLSKIYYLCFSFLLYYFII